VTALLSRDGTTFNLACDHCGQMAGSPADAGHAWDAAWVVARGHGWAGDTLATGTHTCPRCTRAPATAQTAEHVPAQPRSAPMRRRSNRIRVTELRVAMVVEVRGGPSVAVNAALHELLLSDRPPRRHIVVDLSRARTLDSGVLDVLVRAQAHAARHSLDLCLVGLPEPMRAALRLLCLADFLPTFADRTEALEWLNALPTRGHQPGGVPRTAMEAA
jgi:anti-anti-sigma regulatory factor